jgi:hypothetical protein
MATPSNVHPFVPDPERSRTEGAQEPAILGKLCRKDFELWVCLSPGGHLSLKWWRWREDVERFQPLEDGWLTLDPGELGPLAELLGSVNNLLERKKKR